MHHAKVAEIRIFKYPTLTNYFPSALWVKSGNRGNLKCLKVNDNFALIFHRKIFISFLSDAKLPKVCD